jgi:hypothetical protein
VIVLPAMPYEQTASWLALLELYEALAHGWTLIGGQLVHLHCAERGQLPSRATHDADAVLDVRADPTVLRTFTRTLTELGFKPAGISAEGRQHRWVREKASIEKDRELTVEVIGAAESLARLKLGATLG